MEAPGPGRLPPLPKETAARVLLAVLAFVAGAIVVGEAAWYTAYHDDEVRVITRCGREAADAAGFLACERGAEHDRVLWTVAWGPAALALAIGGAALGSRLRRRRLTEFPVERLPAVADVSAGAALAVGLRSPPTLLWRPARPIAMARADGFVKPYVEVGPSLLSRSLCQPAAAAATFRHEDGHLKLRDVAASRVMWWSGPVGAAVLVAFVVAAWDTGVGTVTSALWRLVLIALAVAAARASVLRAREFDADRCAAASDPQGVLDALQGPVPGRRRWDAFLAPFRHHPSLDARRCAVTEPWLVCRLGVLDAVLVGLTTSVAAPTLTRLARTWFQHGDPGTYAEVIGWGIAGAFAGAWLTMMLLRAVVGARTAGTRVRLGAFAWTFAAVLLVGQRVYSDGLYVPIRPWPDTVVGWATFVALPVGTVVATLWIRGAIELWLDGREGTAGNARERWVAIGVGALLTALLLGTLANLETVGTAFDQFPAQAIAQGVDPSDPYTVLDLVRTVAHEWFAVVLAALALVIPLLLVLRRRRVRDDVTRADATRAVVLGVMGAIAGVVAYALYRDAWDPLGDAARNGWYATLRTASASPVIAGGVVGCAAAALAAVEVTAPVTFAGFAAVIGGVVGGVGAWLVADLPPDLWFVLTDVVLVALLAGLLGAALVVALGAGGRARRGRAVVVVAATLAGAIALVALGLAQTDAVAPAEVDRRHYWPAVNAVITPGEIGRLVVRACVMNVDPVSVPELRRVGRQLAEPEVVPSTPPLRAYHSALRDLVARCTDANAHALRAGSPTFLSADVQSLVRAERAYLTARQATPPVAPT